VCNWHAHTRTPKSMSTTQEISTSIRLVESAVHDVKTAEKRQWVRKEQEEEKEEEEGEGKEEKKDKDEEKKDEDEEQKEKVGI